MAAKRCIAVNCSSKCWVTELKELTQKCGNYVQVVEVVSPGGDAIVITNVYDQHDGSQLGKMYATMI